MKNRQIIPVFTILVLFLIISVCGLVNAESGQFMLAEYFDLLTSENFESASYFWSEECRDRATKFGIEYDNIPLKLDCTSPIIRNYDIMRYHLTSASNNMTRFPPNFIKIEFATEINAVEVKHDFYMKTENKYRWFIYPQDYYANSWPSVESKYFKIIYYFI